MSLSSALLALTIVAAQGADQAAFTFEGKPVPYRLVSKPKPEPTTEFLAWDGWQFLNGPSTGVFSPYPVAANWQAISKAFEEVKAKPGPVWRSKIFVFTRTEIAERDPSGVLRIDRNTLYDKPLIEVMEAIGRVKAWIKADFGVDFQPDVEAEDDVIRWAEFGPAFAEWYVGPRINGALYDAEDKVFRGPYQSAFYIIPSFGITDPQPSIVNGTPVTGLFTESLGTGADSGRLDVAMYNAFRQQVVERLRMQGYRGEAKAELPDMWTLAVSVDEPATDSLLTRLREGRAADLPKGSLPSPLANWWLAPGTDVSIVDDADRGKVLRVKEQVYYRMGGVGLPMGAPISVGTAPTLTLLAKASDADPISIRVQGKDSAFWVSFGRDPIPTRPSSAVVGSAPFINNGQWQKMTVDLRPLAKQAGVTEIVGLAIEPSPNAHLADIVEYGSSEYLFDDIKLSAEDASPLLPPLQANFASKDPEERALAVAQAQQSTEETLAALADTSPVVRLNATALYNKVKEPKAEAALTKNISDLLAPIQELSVLAVASLGTESSVATLRNTINFTIGDLAKATAARKLAETGNIKYTGDLLLLLMGANWQTAIATVESLEKLHPGLPQARHVFLRSLVPTVRLRTVQLLDMKAAGDQSAAQWHAVNDPSDVVRAAAYGKLIASGNAALAEEGYKGVRDDSRYTRVFVLNDLATNPKIEHRKAIGLGLADRSAMVRAAAIRALAVQPGDVTTEEIELVANDKHPDVQLALIELAAKKSVKLPSASVTAMKESPDPRVKQAANGLSG